MGLEPRLGLGWEGGGLRSQGPVNPGGEFNHRNSRHPGMGLERGTPSSVIA